MSKKFYVVWKGEKTGIFTNWGEVQAVTAGRSDAQFMGFPSKAEAEQAFASSYTKALMKRSLTKKTSTPSKAKSSPSTTASASTKQSSIEIYSDGACSPNPGKSGTGLAVYEKIDDKMQLTSLYYGLYQAMGTNNTAELNGLLSAFRLADHILAKGQHTSIDILSDSKYSIDCITKWAKGWQAKGWTRGKGEEIKNLEVIQQSYALYLKLKKQVQVIHVKGHADIEGNELADRMAVLARKEQQVPLTPYKGKLDIKAILAMESG
ncbi:ribonuclease H family protein [Litorilituus sediminis]|uniref:ribonuclease H n=1 Tax=Litorilituus sediminis TaxID=718192 RepID=A0A4P6PCZ4_9GAMM|nr:ribonuclease H family protein [Litorilituus sediminis]QBG37655.1 ribonuclease HI [Litorilituus sediminis]